MLNDADGDGVCDEDEIEGCFDEAACNYNAEVTDINNDLCDYADEFYDCEGNCLNDSDGDGLRRVGNFRCTNASHATTTTRPRTMTIHAPSQEMLATMVTNHNQRRLRHNCDCAGEVDGISEPVIRFGMFEPFKW